MGAGAEVDLPPPVDVFDGTGMSELALFVYGQLTAAGRLRERIQPYILGQAR